jgi:antitoxin component YwqK of YwqJK toxin-antitoxin module
MKVLIYSVVFFFFFSDTFAASNASLNLGQTVMLDSINQTVEGKKEGYWIIYGKMRTLEEYLEDDVIEEGMYKNSRKEGVWRKYYPGGQIKSEITYIKGRPTGTFEIYYKNGQLEEKGNWKGRIYTGSFERYYEDGTLSQKKDFNEKGKTEGVVEYYHTNGQLELTFTTDNGKESGTASRYWPNGDLKETIEFNEEGEGSSSGVVDRINPAVELPVFSNPEVEDTGIIAAGDINLGSSKEVLAPKALSDGYHKTYNDNKDILMDGEFLGGKLWNGKHYMYDENGLLEKIEVYKDGKFAGTGVM